MGIAYVAAAVLVVPAILFVFHLLSRPPDVSSQPPQPRPEQETVVPSSLAEEAERWLRSQSRS